MTKAYAGPKKILLIITALLLAAAVLTGCGKKGAAEETAVPYADNTSVPSDQLSVSSPSPSALPTQIPEELLKLPGPGYYKLISSKWKNLEFGEEEVAMLEQMGMHWYLVLREDGTGYMYTFGSNLRLTWTENSIVETATGENINFYATKDSIALFESASGAEVVFLKSDGEPPEVSPVTVEMPEAPAHIERAGWYKLSRVTLEGHDVTSSVNNLLYTTDRHFFLVLEPEGTGFLHEFNTEYELLWSDTSLYLVIDGMLSPAMPYEIAGETLSCSFGSDPSVNNYTFTYDQEESPARGDYLKYDFEYADPLEEIDPEISHPEAVNFSGQTLIDNEYVLITADSIEIEDDGRIYEIMMTATNRTEDKILEIRTPVIVVNGLGTYSSTVLRVYPGDTEAKRFGIDLRYLKYGGIDPFALEFLFSVSEVQMSGTDDLFKERVTIYPLGPENTGAPFERPKRDDDMVCDYGADVLEVTLSDVKQFSYGILTSALFLENKTEKNVTVEIQKLQYCSNSHMADPHEYTLDIVPGGQAVLFPSFSTDGISIRGDVIPGDISFILEVRNTDDPSEVLLECCISFNLEGQNS